MASTIKLKNGSGEPLASDLVQGEPALDLTNKRLYTEDSGGTVIEVGTNPTELQVDNININGNAITSTDTNGNITITPNGTGEVDISKVDIDGGAIDGTVIGGTTTAAGSFTTLQADTSLNVTGTVTADGLTVGSSTITESSNDLTINATDDLFFQSNSDLAIAVNANEGTGELDFVRLYKRTGEALQVACETGDISFYDSLANQAFYWDATNARLGIGTTDPSGLLHLSANTATTTLPSIVFQDTGTTATRLGSLTNNNGDLVLAMTSSLTDLRSAITLFDDRNMTFSTGGSEAMRIDSSGNVGIKTGSDIYANSIVHAKDVNAGGDVALRVQNSSTTSGSTTSLRFNNTTVDYSHVTLTADRDRNLIFKNTNDTVETARIDSSGNLLVGTTDDSPYNNSAGTSADNGVVISAGRLWAARFGGSPIDVNRTNSDGDIAVFRKDGSPVGSIGTSGGHVTIGNADSGDGGAGVRFVKSSGNDRIEPWDMRFNTIRDAQVDLGSSDPNRFRDLYLSGAVYLNTTGNPSTTGQGSAFVTSTNNKRVLQLATTVSTSEVMAAFYNSNGFVGGISTSGSSTSYATSSDYRLKENVVDMTGAVDRVKALNPSQFNFIADPDKTVDGFLAHEVSDVVPEAVTGTKDAMTTEEYEVTPAVLDDDGNVVTEAVMGTREVPDYQGIDQSKLVPLLTGALQEAIARIETLEAQVLTLQGN